jgi:hypothetical protein
LNSIHFAYANPLSAPRYSNGPRDYLFWFDNAVGIRIAVALGNDKPVIPVNYPMGKPLTVVFNKDNIVKFDILEHDTPVMDYIAGMEQGVHTVSVRFYGKLPPVFQDLLNVHV